MSKNKDNIAQELLTAIMQTLGEDSSEGWELDNTTSITVLDDNTIVATVWDNKVQRDRIVARVKVTIDEVKPNEFRQDHEDFKPDEDSSRLRLIRSNLGDLMTWENFVLAVEGGGFIDEDGFGDLATETHVSEIRVNPSDVRIVERTKPKWATHVLWYNK